jgi:hypothetical protein
MAQKNRQKRNSVVSRLRAQLRKLKSKRKPILKTKTNTNMSYGRKRSFRNPFRSRSSFRQKRSFRGGGGGGFSRRMPLLGFRVPSIFLWLAIIGGGMFLGKDYIKPLIDRFTKNN